MRENRARFCFIDGLRGLAAMSVVLYHVYADLAQRPGGHLVPRAAGFLLSHAFLGVEIFFVISGFVIAHSTWRAWVTPAYAGRFLLRRSIRLDPPYWCAILGTLILGYLSHHTDAQFPDWSQVAAHFVYLQGILKKGQLLDVFWTLCLEVQFYLFYICLLAIVAPAPRRQAGDPKRTDNPADDGQRLAIVLWVLGILSAVFFAVGGKSGGWFIEYWFMFAAGALAYCAYRQALSVTAVLGYVAILIGCAIYSRSPEFVVIGVITVFVLFTSRENIKSDWLNWRCFQFLGLISYSLYLVHALVLQLVLIQGHRIIHSEIGSLGLACAGILISVGCATVMYAIIERPSIALADRLRPRPSAGAEWRNLDEQFDCPVEGSGLELADPLG